jgi:hypothetical protein
LLEVFIRDTESDIRRRNRERFAGAVKSYLTSHPPKGKGWDAGVDDPAGLLAKGTQLQAPKNCRNFTDFLNKLAYQADTIATGSFVSSPGQRMKPPKVDLISGSAFEILAAAIDNKDISMHTTQEGYWEFNYRGDETSRFRYIGTGGLMCKFEGCNRRADREHIWFHPSIFFDSAIKRDVVSVQWAVKVVEAVDDRGRKMPIPQAKPQWSPASYFVINLGKQNPPAKKISKLVIRTAAAVGIKWVEFEVKRLDHTKPAVFERDGVKVQVEPLEENGRRIFVQITKTGMRTRAFSNEKISLRGEYRLIGSDGSKISFGRSGSSCLSGEAKIGLHTVSKFDPASTSLYIREPIEIEPVPLEFTFHDIPIVDR